MTDVIIEKSIFCDVCASLVLIMMIITMALKRISFDKASRAFFVATIVILLSSLFSIGASLVDNMGAGHIAAKYFFHTGYLWLHNLTAAVYLVYLIQLTDTMHFFRKHKVIAAGAVFPVLAVTIALAINFFVPVMFDLKGSNDVYTHMDWFIILYIASFFYLVLGVFYVLSHARLFTRKWIVTLFAIYPIIVIATIIELFHPNWNIEMICQALGMMFVFTNIQKPDTFVDSTTGLLNNVAYESDCRKAFINDKPVIHIIIDINNARSIKELFSDSSYEELNAEITGCVKGILSDKKKYSNLYILRKDLRFAITVEETHSDEIDSIAADIMDNVMNIQGARELTLSPQVNICIIRSPEDVKNFETLERLVNDIDSQNVSGQLIKVGTLLNDEHYLMMLEMDRIIETAISTDSFEVFYQPIYSVAENRFVSAEALLRHKHEKYGYVPIQLLVNAAEENGTIDIIGNMVLEKVCRFMSGEEFRSLDLSWIDVNLSVKQCLSENLLDTVNGIVDRYGIDHGMINFEITETMIADAKGAFNRNISKLKENGYSVSLDDFGSGYSNLQRLALTPFEIIKLDKSLADRSDNEKTQIMLKNIMTALKELENISIIEGVETEEQLATFRQIGAEFIQGYFFSRPLNQDAFVDFVRENNKKA